MRCYLYVHITHTHTHTERDTHTHTHTYIHTLTDHFIVLHVKLYLAATGTSAIADCAWYTCRINNTFLLHLASFRTTLSLFPDLPFVLRLSH
jgi:hypothetical protein